MAKKQKTGYTTTREVYKTVKKYDHQQFDEFCTRVYTSGFNDGKTSVTEKPIKSITDEQLMEVIGEVKGVGPALKGKIKEAIEAKFGSIGNGKKTDKQEGTIS
ncbi:glutathione peroxidase [Blautia sp. MSJ-9]|uniref:glutathione peroxidase n=1 Tax=Blautia sp. MSJ-9 TaxID=2841511 RepID=UPI001C106E83|nr:glutathione peroxidase [Blautia sp. MSJ-9]MBU5680112.1 glutathione peroxidase [Blautia sp. MSJ-9]